MEHLAVEKVGCKFAVALSAGTAAIHLCIKLVGIKLGDYVFSSDMTFGATVNPVTYEGGIPIFNDTERDTWNMDLVALEKAFELYPDVKVVVCANLYGTLGKIDEIKAVCEKTAQSLSKTPPNHSEQSTKDIKSAHSIHIMPFRSTVVELSLVHSAVCS